ncbi:hypothetical protein KSP40_PGU000408 [Platanthera guangdongensis]|uniref:Uncharacterized protein n=1 Tax=Platanthera guangdongensis TaxID=2320717 RepID=A0ABR2LNG4_9ASPA
MCYFNVMILGPSQSPYEDDNLILVVGFLLFLLSDSFEVWEDGRKLPDFGESWLQ